MDRQQRPITHRELKAWLAAGAVDRGVGEGSTFVASTIAAQAGKASWILRHRLNGRSKEKVLGRYPELTLTEAQTVSILGVLYGGQDCVDQDLSCHEQIR